MLHHTARATRGPPCEPDCCPMPLQRLAVPIQAEWQEAGHQVLADRMKRQDDAEVVRNLSHAKELDRQQYIQRLRDIEANEARQFEMANKEYQNMKQANHSNKSGNSCVSMFIHVTL